MRKVDIVRRIAEDIECTITQADAAVAAILAAVKEGLQEGDPVILRRFGTFRVRAKRVLGPIPLRVAEPHQPSVPPRGRNRRPAIVPRPVRVRAGRPE